MFYLNQLTSDQLKWLSWFVMGALVDYNTRISPQIGGLGVKGLQAHHQNVLNKIIRFLKGEQAIDASFTDFQATLALEARQLFNPRPIGYVTNGDAEHTYEGQLPPNFANGIENEAQARYWMDECKLRVLPVYVGKAVGKFGC
jgi:hypothetical protein